MTTTFDQVAVMFDAKVDLDALVNDTSIKNAYILEQYDKRYDNTRYFDITLDQYGYAVYFKLTHHVVSGFGDHFEVEPAFSTLLARESRYGQTFPLYGNVNCYGDLYDAVFSYDTFNIDEYERFINGLTKAVTDEFRNIGKIYEYFTSGYVNSDNIERLENGQFTQQDLDKLVIDTPINWFQYINQYLIDYRHCSML